MSLSASARRTKAHGAAAPLVEHAAAPFLDPAAATLVEHAAACVADPAALLAWYDRHRRALPWRALPGESADPYRVWLSEIMLQQTTVKAVAPYFAKFLDVFPTVAALAAADLNDVLKLWAGLGYYARARNMHACAKAVAARHGGIFPCDVAALRALPGIGDYTAAAVASIAYDTPAMPVDGNVERVVSRLYAVEDALPGAKRKVRTLAEALAPPSRAGDFAQAMMDLGATICTPRNPACALCPWREPCAARARGDAGTFPRKTRKAEGRLRRGAAFVVRRGHETDLADILVRTRPEKGLLGGMTEVPGSDWSHDFSQDAAMAQAPRIAGLNWRRLPGNVTYVFTHFPLELCVYVAAVAHDAPAPKGMRWLARSEVAAAAFPGVMRKVLAHAGIDAPIAKPKRSL